MSRLIYIETTTDPVTGEELEFRATTEQDLDEQIDEHFGTASR